MIRMISGALVVLFLSGSSSFAQITPAPGFSYETEFFGAPFTSLTFPPCVAPSFTAFLYGLTNLSSTGSPSTFNSADSSGTSQIISTLPTDNAQLVFGKGASADRLYLNDVGSPGSFPDGIYELSPSGDIVLLNDLGGGNPDPQVEALPSSWGDLLCIANPTSSATSAVYNQSLTLVDLDGNFVSTLLSSGDGPWFLAAPESVGGAYGDYLYFNFLYEDGIYRIDSTGNTELFCSGVDTLELGFGRGGDFGNFLYAWESGGDLLRIDPSGNSAVVLSGLVSSRFDFDPATGDLYTHELGVGMVRVYEPDAAFQRADCNQDGSLDVSDPIGVLDELFSGGVPSGCEKACDANDDGTKDIGDVIFTLNFLFNGGMSPPTPFGACGTDPSADSLTCDSFAACP